MQMLAISFGAVGPDDINLLIPGYDLVYDFKEFLLFVFLAEAVFMSGDVSCLIYLYNHFFDGVIIS